MREWSNATMDYAIEHEESGTRGVFHLRTQGRRVGELTYRRTGPAQVVADHTWVDPSLRGQGAARHLQDALVAWARSTQTKVVPQCSYVRVQFERNADMRDVRA